MTASRFTLLDCISSTWARASVLARNAYNIRFSLSERLFTLNDVAGIITECLTEVLLEGRRHHSSTLSGMSLRDNGDALTSRQGVGQH